MKGLTGLLVIAGTSACRVVPTLAHPAQQATGCKSFFGASRGASLDRVKMFGVNRGMQPVQDFNWTLMAGYGFAR